MATFPAPCPLPAAWWSFDLGDYRPCDGTYQLYEYDSLPPLTDQTFRGDFEWLSREAGEPEPTNEDALASLETSLRAAGLALPPGFARFMGDISLQDAVPSCTACEWDLSGVPAASPLEAGAFTVRFLRDQQDCLFWSLYLAPGRAPIVICSDISFDDPDIDLERDVVMANTWAVAPDFEQFVYRFWLENELWDLVNDEPDDDDLTPAQAAYLKHYRNA